MNPAFELLNPAHTIVVAVSETDADQLPHSALLALAPHAHLSGAYTCPQHLIAVAGQARTPGFDCSPAQIVTWNALPADRLAIATCTTLLAAAGAAVAGSWHHTTASTPAARTLREFTGDPDDLAPDAFEDVLAEFLAQPRIAALTRRAHMLGSPRPDQLGAAIEAHQEPEVSAYVQWLAHNTMLGQAYLDHHGLLTPRPRPVNVLLYTLAELRAHWAAVIERITALPAGSVLCVVHADLTSQTAAERDPRHQH
ncbi:hypothetical protein AB0B31_11025 [Catellatospora citrea]|uniref:hypothetical protein n=1 Tax=Catellatospora citrea TaxID=53366 RepID=UPI0033DDDD17